MSPIRDPGPMWSVPVPATPIVHSHPELEEAIRDLTKAIRDHFPKPDHCGDDTCQACNESETRLTGRGIRVRLDHLQRQAHDLAERVDANWQFFATLRDETLRQQRAILELQEAIEGPPPTTEDG